MYARNVAARSDYCPSLKSGFIVELTVLYRQMALLTSGTPQLLILQ